MIIIGADACDGDFQGADVRGDKCPRATLVGTCILGNGATRTPAKCASGSANEARILALGDRPME